jgi:aminoglycoside phosphotransferase (APT) family kinase protein
VAAQRGRGWKLRSCEPLLGGRSHATHAVRLTGPGGRVETLVLRRWARPDHDADPEFTASHEAATLAVLERGNVAAPRLVAVDPTGGEVGVPAVLQTFVSGHRPDPRDLDAFASGLAEALVSVHALTDERARAATIPFAPYYKPERVSMPRATSRPDLWREAFAVHAQPPPSAEPCFIHRDYHQGNTLWEGPRLSGIVDWDRASWTSPAADVAHMRINLVIAYGRPVADLFTTAYGRLSGRPLPDLAYWDIEDTVDLGLNRPGLGSAAENERVEAFVADALAALGA